MIMSSIFKPSVWLCGEKIKVSERLKIIEWGPWSSNDINKLVELISSDTASSLPENVSTESFEGIPRAVKNYFRNEILKAGLRV